jgi:Zn-dependent protease with chaperone function
VTIAIGCSRCGAQWVVKDEFAGRRGKCPKCQSTIEVPAVARQPGQPAPGPSIAGAWPSGVPSPPRVSAPKAHAQEAAAAMARADASKLPRSPVPKPARDDQAAAGAGGPNPPKPPSQGPADAQAILAALSGRIDPVRASVAYKAAALLVFAVMLLLPVLYVGITALVAYAVYLHVVYDTWLILPTRGGGRATLVALLIYVAPVVVGAVLLLFLCKPLFARPARRGKRRSLTRQGEPLLFAYVDKLSAAVGAPTPKRIDVDCQINASASLRRGWWSMLGSDMVLTIGLPLAAGMNLRQFSGVLAHELGHFSQGWGMRLSYGIRRINFWFTRVVYERDAWDQRLAEWSHAWDWRLQIVLLLARGCVWLTRKVLWLLMMLGHAVSGVLLRQMEFDADLHEVRLAGSDAFEATFRRLTVLTVATNKAYADLGHWYREGRLGDDLPTLIVANVGQMPRHVLATIDRQLQEPATGWLDTHPANGQRIARAKLAKCAGLFHDERPATALFSDFAALSKTVTFDFYKGALGSAVQITDLHPTEKLLARQQREDAGGRALGRYLQGAWSALRPLPFATGWIEAPTDPRASVARLRQLRDVCARGAAAYLGALADFDKADTTLLECEQAGALLYADFKLKSTTFSEPLTNSGQVRRVRAAAEARAAQALAILDPFERAAAERMTAALQMLHVAQVAAKIPEGAALPERCRDLLCAAVAIRGVMASLVELRNVHASTFLLVQSMQGHQGDESLYGAISKGMRALHRTIDDVRSRLNNVDYPFRHGRGKMSIAVYLCEMTPSSDDLGGQLTAGDQILDRLPPLLTRLMSQLAVAAELAENAVGLPPLAEPQAHKPAGGPPD